MLSKKMGILVGIFFIIGIHASALKEKLLSYLNTNQAVVNGTLIRVIAGDIIDPSNIHYPNVNIVVNAANPQVQFRGMAGVTKAIADAAGDDLPKLEEAVAKAKSWQLPQGQHDVPVGDVLVTSGKFLDTKHMHSIDGNMKKVKFSTIIHAVAPDLRELGGTVHMPTEEDKKLLKLAYMRSILYKPFAKGPGQIIAFPLLGAGVYGWDKKTAMEIAAQAAVASAQAGLIGNISEIRFVLFWDPKKRAEIEQEEKEFMNIIHATIAQPNPKDLEFAQEVKKEMNQRRI